LTDFELNSLVIVQRIAPTNLGLVEEQIFSATVGGDKAIALTAVEPFDGSLCHALNFLMLADLEEHTAASLPDAGLTLVRTAGSGVALLAAPLASQGSSASSAAYGVTFTSASSAAWANRTWVQQVSRFSYLQQSGRGGHHRRNSCVCCS